MKAIKSIKYLLKLMFKVSPSFIILTIVGSLFSSVQVIGNVILPKFLIDELITNKNITNALIWGGVIVGFNLIINFINKTYSRVLDVKNSKVSFLVMKEMSNKIMNVEYRHLEDPYYLDLKERAIFACNNQNSLGRVVSGISGIITNIITIISLIAIMLTLGFVLIGILFVGIIITLLVNKIFMKYQLSFFQSIIPINRQYNYYFNLTYNEQLSKDMRLYNMSPIILGRVQHYNRLNAKSFMKFAKYAGVVGGAQRVLTAIQHGLIYLYVAWRIISDAAKKITIGDFTMYANAAINFTLTFNNFFNNIIDMSQVLGYLDPFVEFMQLPDAVSQHSELHLNDVETIEFKNVDFTYPKSENKILDNVSFKINKGEKISIVGLNGAGKTTIIKLLCRFYQPDAGEILINGRDIFSYDYESYINEIAVVFQDYKIFAFSIKENITGDSYINEDRIDEIVDEVGLKEKINELKNGLDTKLNKSFDDDGVELSGGQGQKIAIGRALYKKASLVILDEPTSALDPIAEAEIYQNFNDLVQEKTAIYISHRMSSSVFCNYVLVLDGGKVVSFDTHENLMKQTNSLYYQLFSTQAKNYKL